MKLGSIFGATFFSVVAALIIYDLLIKGAVSGLFNKFDNTFDNSGESVKQIRKIVDERVNKLAA